MTGAGTSLSIASWTVQRPSPESATQPLRCSRSWPVGLERPHHQLQQPGADHGPVHPHLGDGGEVQRVVAGVHDLEALGVRLHQAVLDAVVDHLHVVPGARSADVEVAALRSERVEDRLQRLHGRVLAADHQGVAHLEAPDPAAGAGIHVADALLRERLLAPDVVVEVRVAAVDDRVAGLQVLQELLDLGLGGIAGRDHDPDRARLRQLLDELRDGEGRLGALHRDLPRLLGRPVVGHDLVAVAKQAANHVRAHPAEADEADAHWGSPLGGRD